VVSAVAVTAAPARKRTPENRIVTSAAEGRGGADGDGSSQDARQEEGGGEELQELAVELAPHAARNFHLRLLLMLLELLLWRILLVLGGVCTLLLLLLLGCYDVREEEGQEGGVSGYTTCTGTRRGTVKIQ